MTPIRTNKPVFFGDNGEVLKNGFIYIGQPNSDPLDFPKSVTYQDATGSQFAAGQPLRTNSQGQISFNGKAIIALVDGDYSMLVQDFNQVTIKDGYTPLIEGVAESGTNQTIIYRSTLANLKQVNVTPGQYVENIGKVSQLEGEGARWLVVSNTGTSGDDVDLIDFANGTQGQRVENQLYGVKNLSDVDAADSRTNLSVYSVAQVDVILTAYLEKGDLPAQLGKFTEVFSGSATAVDLSSLPGGHPGTGLYLIKQASSVIHYLLYIIQGSDYSEGTSRTSFISSGSGELFVTVAEKSTADDVRLPRYKIDMTAGSITKSDQTISNIYKIGD